jgi:hypothetical protein
MSDVEKRAIDRIALAMMIVGLGLAHMVRLALAPDQDGGNLASSVLNILCGCLFYAATSWALTRRVQGARRGRADALESLARGPWAALVSLAAFASLLQLVLPAMDGLLAPFGRGSSAWWAASIALYCQLAVLWALLCTGGRVAWRHFTPMRPRRPLWRAAADDLAIGAFVGGLLLMRDLDVDLRAVLSDPFVGWAIVGVGLIVLFTMLRDWRLTRRPRPRRP